MTVSVLPHPLTETQWLEIQHLLKGLSNEQCLWLSGFLAAQGGVVTPLRNERVQLGPELPSRATSSDSILIAFGSETGNCKNLAQHMAALANGQGIAAEVADLAQLRVRHLSKRRILLVICSTHGDGDPPEPIHGFFEALMDDASAPKLQGLKYSVLALGDSSYEQFCVTGAQLDERFASLGAQRLAPRQDCDVDFAEPAKRWMESVLGTLASDQGSQAIISIAAQAEVGAELAPEPARSKEQAYNKQQPLRVEVLENICLSDVSRHSPIHHLELALDVADFPVAPGDAVGVLTDNPPALVAAILDAVSLSGEQAVVLNGNAMPLVQALRSECDLTIPSKRFLEIWAQITGHLELVELKGADAVTQRAYLRSVQIRDLVTRYPARPDAQVLVDSLRPLQPRLYDVANSIEVTNDELHLTVKLYRYPFAGREETGIASDYLVQVQPGENLRIYPHHNQRFRLPDDFEAPLILIADGTGIAPYRAFLQEMSLGKRKHPCWLIFCEKSFEQDFLYQLDWQQWHQQGLIQRMDTLFADTQPEREPAHAVAENADQFLAWLQQGGHLYLCGDKDRLSLCEQELQALFEAHTGLRWKELNGTKRIHRNLY